MSRILTIQCPHCRGHLEIDSQNGEIVRKWGAQEKPPSAEDRFADALKKVQNQKKELEGKFQTSKEQLQSKKKEAQEIFEKGIRQVQQEGGKVERPQREIDLD
ncbi:MAG TPA: hypothetical protein PK876_03755 [Elusimicrobiota bacterium]|nr:hypothetical protein [Elusimicrobiota bacterium]